MHALTFSNKAASKTPAACIRWTKASVCLMSFKHDAFTSSDGWLTGEMPEHGGVASQYTKTFSRRRPRLSQASSRVYFIAAASSAHVQSTACRTSPWPSPMSMT